MKKEEFAKAAVSPEGHRARLRQRFLERGEDSFSDAEKLELLLTYSIPRRDTKVIAKNLLLRFKSLGRIFRTEKKELCTARGIGERSADLIAAIGEFNELFLNVKAGKKRKITSAKELEDFIDDKFNKQYPPSETMMVLFCNSRCGLINAETFPPEIPRSELCRKITVRGLDLNAAVIIVLVFLPQSGRDEWHIKFKNELLKSGQLLHLLLIDYLFVYQDKTVSICKPEDFPGKPKGTAYEPASAP